MKESEAVNTRKVNTENLISALDSVTWYNGLAEYVTKWKTDCPRVEGTLVPEESYCCGEIDSVIYDQLQVIWMICVELFGDYGTSPRLGWIEDVDGFCEFIDDITALQRDYDEREGITRGGQHESMASVAR